MESAVVPAGFRLAERKVTDRTLCSEPAPPRENPQTATVPPELEISATSTVKSLPFRKNSPRIRRLQHCWGGLEAPSVG